MDSRHQNQVRIGSKSIAKSVEIVGTQKTHQGCEKCQCYQKESFHVRTIKKNPSTFDFIRFFSRLYDLEPDRTVTGGAWYSDQDFESEFVEILNQQCCRFLQQKLDMSRKSLAGPLVARNESMAKLQDVHKFISDLVNIGVFFALLEKLHFQSLSVNSRLFMFLEKMTAIGLYFLNDSFLFTF